jgi:Skp family chaperone for outer membrane proteins
LLREFRDFEDNISIEQRDLAIQRARIQEELEFHRRRLANLDDEGDQTSLRDKEREHRRNIHQMEEELREKERDIERRTREESHEVRAKCRRVPPDRIRCEARGCGVIIDPKQEQYYRKSCTHAPAIIQFMWYLTDSGILK